MDTLFAMRTFVSIVDHGSLTAAAEALDRSQPAVVRSLAALEGHLGARLLQRTTRRMSLTPEGSEYLQRCRQIIADVDEAERAVAQDQGDPQGSLRMTAPVQFGRLHLARVRRRAGGEFLPGWPGGLLVSLALALLLMGVIRFAQHGLDGETAPAPSAGVDSPASP